MKFCSTAFLMLLFLKGRNGKGAIFVMASGNGGLNNDSCAANGYASSIYTIAVGSIDQSSLEASFDEECAAKMVLLPSILQHFIMETYVIKL